MKVSEICPLPSSCQCVRLFACKNWRNIESNFKKAQNWLVLIHFIVKLKFMAVKSEINSSCVECNVRFQVLTVVLIKVVVFWELCTQNYRKIPQNTRNCYPIARGTNYPRVQRASCHKTWEKVIPETEGTTCRKIRGKNYPITYPKVA